MAKYRKKLAVIEAWQFDPGAEIVQGIPRWFYEALAKWPGREEWQVAPSGAAYFVEASDSIGAPPYYLIKTLEGPLIARVGDWIIRGVKGEFYPCKPDIFEQTYDAVQGD